jgi:hypothetical protein
MDRCSERENPYPPAQLTSPARLTGFAPRRFAPPLHLAQHTAYPSVSSTPTTRSQAPRSPHNSHVLVSSASLALGRARAHSLIHGFGGASRLGIELVLGHMLSSLPATGAVRLGDMSDVDGSEGALSNPESHTFGLPIVGGASSLLPSCGWGQGGLDTSEDDGLWT